MEMASDQHAKRCFSIRAITWIGLLVNLLLSILKFCAGVFSHSQVLLADAVHSLSDLSTDFAILIGVRFWEKPADEQHPNGHGKIETLVTMLIGGILFLVGLGLISQAVETIAMLNAGKKLPMPGEFALIAAVLSIIFKEILFQLTWQTGHRSGSSAVIANAWHHRSDALSSIPAAFAVFFCLFLGEEYAFLDPVGTILVSCMILYTALKIISPTFSILLDRGASAETIGKIRTRVLANHEVFGLHKIRTRPLGGNKYAMDLHIQVDRNMTISAAHELSHKIQADLCQSSLGIVDVAVHVEPYQ